MGPILVFGVVTTAIVVYPAVKYIYHKIEYELAAKSSPIEINAEEDLTKIDKDILPVKHITSTLICPDPIIINNKEYISISQCDQHIYSQDIGPDIDGINRKKILSSYVISSRHPTISLTEHKNLKLNIHISKKIGIDNNIHIPFKLVDGNIVTTYRGVEFDKDEKYTIIGKFDGVKFIGYPNVIKGLSFDEYLEYHKKNMLLYKYISIPGIIDLLLF